MNNTKNPPSPFVSHSEWENDIIAQVYFQIFPLSGTQGQGSGCSPLGDSDARWSVRITSYTLSEEL